MDIRAEVHVELSVLRTVRPGFWRGRSWIPIFVTTPFEVPVGDKSPVFHGSSAEVRNSNHVLFGQWVLFIEIIFEELQSFGAYLDWVPSLADGTTARPHRHLKKSHKG